MRRANWRAWLRYDQGLLTFHFVGTPHEALELFGAALASGPRHVKSLGRRGFVDMELGDSPAAAADGRRALEFGPEQDETQDRRRIVDWLVATLHSLGRTDEAQSVERAESARRAGAKSGG